MRVFLYFSAIGCASLGLSACAVFPNASSDQVNWDGINYAEITCAGENRSKPGCQNKPEDTLSTIGRGKGR